MSKRELCFCSLAAGVMPRRNLIRSAIFPTAVAAKPRKPHGFLVFTGVVSGELHPTWPSSPAQSVTEFHFTLARVDVHAGRGGGKKERREESAQERALHPASGGAMAAATRGETACRHMSHYQHTTTWLSRTELFHPMVIRLEQASGTRS